MLAYIGNAIVSSDTFYWVIWLTGALVVGRVFKYVGGKR